MLGAEQKGVHSMAMSPTGKRWNLFARELEDILQAHGLHLGHLTTKLGIHTETVRRLKQSLTHHKFHLLNPQELEDVITFFGFTNEEQLRIRAALLATAIEELLMNRIDPEIALEAAEEVFPILLNALRKSYGRKGIGATRREVIRDESALDDLLDPILEQLNHAMLALHLGKDGNNEAECLEKTQNAANGFTNVLAELESLSRQNHTLRNNEAWKLWYREAQNGLTEAQRRLEDFKP